MKFESRPGCAVDPVTGLIIYAPRLEPGYPPDAPGTIGFEYAVYLGDERDGFTVSGRETIDRDGEFEQHLLKLHFDEGRALENLLIIKKNWRIDGEPFEFLTSIAHGALLALAERMKPDHEMRFCAVASAGEVMRLAVAIPEEAASSYDTQIVLADIRFAAHVEEGLHS